ncbi:hypothetical protein Q1695_008701 [Nippostrongylus brasiliensis]|nr:hypothetical protein Q1695_008701 [Nippostrongylus brasiliensis]
MLSTCVTVSIIFAMLIYEISYSLKESVNEVIENLITDDSSILDFDRISLGASDVKTPMKEYLMETWRSDVGEALYEASMYTSGSEGDVPCKCDVETWRTDMIEVTEDVF